MSNALRTGSSNIRKEMDQQASQLHVANDVACSETVSNINSEARGNSGECGEDLGKIEKKMRMMMKYIRMMMNDDEICKNGNE